MLALIFSTIEIISHTTFYDPRWRPRGMEFFSNAMFEMFVLLAWSAMYFGINYYLQFQQEREKALKAISMAHQAQLKMLRYQLNPHFLFNTLNAISTLVLIVVGLLASFEAFSYDLARGGLAVAKGSLFFPFTDMVIFAPLFLAAIKIRRRPEVHKRLMLVAVVFLLIAPVSRISLPVGGLLAFTLRHAIWLSPVLLAMASDFRTRRMLHPIFIGAVLLLPLTTVARTAVVQTRIWQDLASWLASQMA